MFVIAEQFKGIGDCSELKKENNKSMCACVGERKDKTRRLSLLVFVKGRIRKLSVLGLVKGKRKFKYVYISWRKSRRIECSYIVWIIEV